MTALIRRLFRNGAPGGSSFDVGFAGSAQEISYKVERGKNWDVYRGTRYPALIDRHVIRVERDWLRRVHNTGLSVVEGALTLSADGAVASEPTIELFAALRARQGRGYNVATEAGFIARDKHIGLPVWAPTADKAAQKALYRRDEIMSLMSDSGLDDAWLHQHGHVHATRRDAYEVGSCQHGVEEWLENAGLADQSSAPLALLHAAWLRDPHASRDEGCRISFQADLTEAASAGLESWRSRGRGHSQMRPGPALTCVRSVQHEEADTGGFLLVAMRPLVSWKYAN